MKKKLVLITGAGISEESGMSVFRGKNGLWENYDPMEVCSVDGWKKNPGLCQKFYNERRVKLEEILPNEAHFICKRLEDSYDVQIITTNVDDLHERAGSNNVLHLHGELTKVCDVDMQNVEDIGYGLLSELSFEKRPFVVFFGEDVPLLSEASEIVKNADILVVVGSSLSVYPAATLLFDFKGNKMFYIDPNARNNISSGDLDMLERMFDFSIIEKKAVSGLSLLASKIT